MRRSAKLFENGCPTERFARFLKDIKITGKKLPEINEGLQAAFVPKKTDGQAVERWSLPKLLETFPEYAIREHLNELGFLCKTMPQKMSYCRAGWPGAKVMRAGARLLDLVEAFNAGVRWKELIVFTGDRPLDVDETILKARLSLHIDHEWTESDEESWGKVKTEGQAMGLLWNWCEMPSDMRALPIHFVSAPMKPNPKGGDPIRPNSEDPVHLWLEKHEPDAGSMLFSSGAPYGPAQDEAMWMILAPLGHEIETFGHAAPSNIGLEALLREVAGTVYRINRAYGS